MPLGFLILSTFHKISIAFVCSTSLKNTGTCLEHLVRYYKKHKLLRKLQVFKDFTVNTSFGNIYSKCIYINIYELLHRIISKKVLDMPKIIPVLFITVFIVGLIFTVISIFY